MTCDGRGADAALLQARPGGGRHGFTLLEVLVAAALLASASVAAGLALRLAARVQGDPPAPDPTAVLPPDLLVADGTSALRPRLQPVAAQTTSAEGLAVRWVAVGEGALLRLLPVEKADP